MLNAFSADASAPAFERIQQPRASSSNDVFRGTSSASAAVLSPLDEKQPSDLRYQQQQQQQQQQPPPPLPPQISPRPQSMLNGLLLQQQQQLLLLQQQAPQISPRPQKPLPVPPSPRLQQSDAATIGIDLR